MRAPRALTVLLALVAAAGGATAGTDEPVRGDLLRLRAKERDPDRRGAAVRFRDPAITAPFPDPRQDGAMLLLHGGSSADQCFVSAELPAAHWTPMGQDGARSGWRYRDRSGAAQGIRKVVVRPGRVTVVARGASWPCTLPAAQRLPVSVVLRVGAQRWCAAFGGAVAVNGRLAFRARRAPAPAACPDADLTVANLNILHGIFCPAGTDDCRFSDRVALLFDWVEAAGCPDAVTLQEVSERQAPVLLAMLPSVCAGSYTAIYGPTNPVDNNVILSRYGEAVRADVVVLDGGFRDVLHARLDHPLGPVDVFTTHLAASLDGAQFPCAAGCPPECLAAGAATRRECQAVQVARVVEQRHDVPTPAAIAGDFNEAPNSFVHAQFTDRGWPDAYLAAGLPECDPATGGGCTAGRADDVLDELESPVSNEIERIDFIFVAPAPGCRVEPAGDPDGDRTSTGLFAHQPNPFAPACGPAPAPICWPSDHVGVQLDVDCR